MVQSSRKRKRAEAQTAPAPQTPRPLSAVEARKAARLAAQAAPQIETLQQQETSANSQPPVPDDDEALVEELQSSDEQSASSASDNETAHRALVAGVINGLAQDATLAAPSRYFQSRASSVDLEDGASITGPSAIAHRAELRARQALECQGDDEAERIEGDAGVQETERGRATDEPPSGAVTPHHRARRRFRPKERAGFLDEACVSSWQPVPEGVHHNLVQDEQGCWIGLQVGETLVPHGTLQLSVYKGTIEIAGAQLAASAKLVDIFAPTSHPLPIMRAISGDKATLPSQSLPLDVSAFSAVVLFSDLHMGAEQIDRPWTLGGAKALYGTRHGSSAAGASTFSIVTQPTSDIASLRLSDSWLGALTHMPSSAPRFAAAIVGPKRAGKSTFATQLVNRLLTHFTCIAVLDVDPGQPLFGPPSLVSLHVTDTPVIGPPHARQAQPVKSHYIGSLTPKDDPARFIAAVHDLVEFYRARLEFREDQEVKRRWRRRSGMLIDRSTGTKRNDLVPLVVNTMGWTKGLGSDLLAQLVDVIQPTHCYTFEPDSLPFQSGPEVIPLEPIGETPLSLRLTPHDTRSLALLSYFHSRIPPPSTEDDLLSAWTLRWRFGEPLVAQRPFSVSWAGNSHEILGVSFLSCSVAADQIGFALNASIVALVVTSVKEGHAPSVGETGSLSLRVPAPSPTESFCLGLALVRGIDPTTKSLHLLTPVPRELLVRHQRSLLLVKGPEPELPVVAMLDWTDTSNGARGLCGVPWDDVPYMSWGGLFGAGGQRQRVRRNVMRKSHQQGLGKVGHNE